MVRSITQEVQRGLNSGRSSSAWIWLVEITHADLTPPIRLCANGEDVSHDGNTYTAFDLGIPIPEEKENELPIVRLRLSNIDNSILGRLRQLEHQLVLKQAYTE